MVIIIVILSIQLLCSTANSEILFTENFDNQPYWSPTEKLVNCFTEDCTTHPPVNWDYYRNDELWHPSEFPNKNVTIQISGDTARGNSGKSFIVWNESNDGSAGDGWGADGILAKDLGNDYHEIYIELYVKFENNFQWYFSESENAMIKIARFYHWDRVGSPFLNFTGGNNCPLYIFDIVQNPWGFRHSHAFRCDPQESSYFCDGQNYGGNYLFENSPSFEETFGDGSWHKLGWHAKMNSAPGIEDGVLEFSFDGVVQYSLSNVAWMFADSPGNLGWNIVAIGGNAFNSYDPDTNQSEQWYAIDDIIVSTTPISVESTAFNCGAVPIMQVH